MCKNSVAAGDRTLNKTDMVPNPTHRSLIQR